jgi:hypothetical protein
VISRGVHTGADKSEVIKYLDTVEVNGMKPSSNGYIPARTPHAVVAPDGRKSEDA